MKSNPTGNTNDIHISLPRPVLRDLDRFTETTGATRSGAIAVALRRFLSNPITAGVCPDTRKDTPEGENATRH